MDDLKRILFTLETKTCTICDRAGVGLVLTAESGGVCAYACPECLELDISLIVEAMAYKWGVK